MSHSCTNKIPVEKVLLGTFFFSHLFLNSSYLFGTNVFRIRYPSWHSVEVSRIVGALQEHQSQDIRSGCILYSCTRSRKLEGKVTFRNKGYKTGCCISIKFITLFSVDFI